MWILWKCILNISCFINCLTVSVVTITTDQISFQLNHIVVHNTAFKK